MEDLMKLASVNNEIYKVAFIEGRKALVRDIICILLNTTEENSLEKVRLIFDLIEKDLKEWDMKKELNDKGGDINE